MNASRVVKFDVSDGTVIEIDVSDKFLSYVRDRLQLQTDVYVSDDHVREVFTEVLKKATHP